MSQAVRTLLVNSAAEYKAGDMQMVHMLSAQTLSQSTIPSLWISTPELCSSLVVSCV